MNTNLYYHWTREDIAADIAWRTRNNLPLLKRAHIVRNVVSALFAVTGILFLGIAADPDGVWFLVASITIFFAYLPLIRVFFARTCKKAYESIPGDILFGDRSVLLEGNALTFQTKEKTTSFPVTEVQSVTDAPHAVYLKLRDSTYAMIPNSAFSDHTRSAFIAALRQSQQ